MTFPKRGHIYLVEFDPARGREIQKTRPAVIVQNDTSNRSSSIIIVAAITSRISPVLSPVHVVVKPNKENGLTMISAIQLNQIRSVDRARLIKHLGAFDAGVMREVDDALSISLGLTKF